MRKIGINIALATALVAAASAQTQQQTQPTTDQTQNSQQQTYPNGSQQTYPTTDQSQQQTYPSNTQQQYPNNTQQPQPQVQSRTQQQANQQQQIVVNSNNPGEIPAGADLYIRADQEIKAENADPQRTYPGTVTRQISTTNGQILIPRGTPVQLAVMDNSQGTNGQGTNGNKSLQLGVTSMNINGNTYNVISDAVSNTSNSSAIGGDQGIGANKRTATHVGGGAILGTVLGAVIGGGKGAAIGAVTGAAAGGAVQVLTKGNKINVPAETEMQFHLDQPIRLQGYNGSNH